VGSDEHVVVGVDGARGGWALAVVEGTSRSARLREWRWLPGPGADAVFTAARAAGAAAVGLDVPLGLPRDDWRPADLLAKRALGAAHARVFLVPPRVVLREADYTSARARAREVLRGKGLSAQTWGLRGPVLALDEAMAEDWTRGHAVETHPEVSFAAMTGEVLASKKTPAGREQRTRALATWLEGPPAPPRDDHLDAAACAWSALRFVEGVADVLGGEPDERGFPQRIVV
jgi:predicted RNase H-like nuclease